jgi:hypothetical protein
MLKRSKNDTLTLLQYWSHPDDKIGFFKKCRH